MKKIELFAEAKNVVTGADIDETLRASLIDLFEKEILSLEKKTVAAKARAEKKKAESDVLKDVIYGLISDEFVTVDTIVLEIGDSEVTRNRVISRLAKLVDDGLVTKGKIKTEDGTRKMAYRLASADTDTDTEAVE